MQLLRSKLLYPRRIQKDLIKKPSDPEYFKKYYHAHSEKVNCQFCGAFTRQFKMFRHVKSQKCLKAQQLNKMISLDDKFLETLDF